MKKFTFSFMVFVLALVATNVTALAQRETSIGVDVETDVLLLRRDLRAEKKQLIALNLPLTETEATKFWPVYDQYAAEIAKHNDEFLRAHQELRCKSENTHRRGSGEHNQAMGRDSGRAFTDATKIYSTR
jgi:hypothetical protein